MIASFKRKITITFIIVVVFLFAHKLPAAEFAGGTGEPNDPYQIATAEQLISIGDDPNLLAKHYVLINDIDLDPNLPGRKIFARAVIAPDTNDGSEFQGVVFSGSFDGNGYAIHNLTIDSDESRKDYIGLFGSVGNGGLIQNLALIDISINVNRLYESGGFAGSNDGTINNCHITGNISCEFALNFGGFVGENVGGNITNCNSALSIAIGEGIAHIGGLVGMNRRGIITHCYITGDISVKENSDRLGGLVGINSGTITRCYNTPTSNVSSGDNSFNIGGLVGDNYGFIINCYSTGTVSCESSSLIGGLVGWNLGKIYCCYAKTSFLGCDNNYILGGLVGKNELGLITSCYSISSVFGAEGSSNLGGLVGTDSDGYAANSFWDIDATGASNSDGGIGLITTQMQDIRTYLDAGWDMVGESANGTSDMWQMSEGSGYPELAVFSEDYQTHTLAGSGTPENPYQIATAEDLGAINHYNLSACYELVANIDLSGITWKTAPVWFYGGIFNGNGFVISGLTIQGGRHLGLFDTLNYASVMNLGIKDVNITSEDFVEEIGIMAAQNTGDIKRCYATGSISIVNHVWEIGGLVGENFGYITDCYTISSISVGDRHASIGGIVGNQMDGFVKTCYSATSISGWNNDDENVVGVLGGSMGDKIADCYFLAASDSSETDNDEDVLPLTDEQMKQQASFVGWDFDDVWTICEGVDYPRLQWENIQCKEEE